MKQISWLSGLSATGSCRAPRVLADRVLRTIADREERARELLLRQREQEIRLILRRIDAAPQQVPPGRLVALDAGVVAGGDRVRAEARGAVGERRELQVAVAVRAGQRRPPAAYSRTKFDDDLLVELPLEVQDVVRNVERRGHAPRVVQIVDRAAAAERRSSPSAWS